MIRMLSVTNFFSQHRTLPWFSFVLHVLFILVQVLSPPLSCHWLVALLCSSVLCSNPWSFCLGWFCWPSIFMNPLLLKLSWGLIMNFQWRFCFCFDCYYGHSCPQKAHADFTDSLLLLINHSLLNFGHCPVRHFLCLMFIIYRNPPDATN